MSQPAARITDMHTCPMVTGVVPHVGGPIISGQVNVLIGGLPAARVSDKATCVGPVDFIVKGAATVLIGGLPAARLGDSTMHGGIIIAGMPTVLIGDASAGGTLGSPVTAAVVFPGQQNYGNCGIQSAQQLVHQSTGDNVVEDAMLDRAIQQGWAEQGVEDADTGGTSPQGRQQILADRGVASNLQEQTIANIEQAVAEGKGVITSHDAGVLWNDPRYAGSGHAIVTTGMKYDKDGKLESVFVNDTGLGQSQMEIPAQQFINSLRPNRDINVTDKPIW